MCGRFALTGHPDTVVETFGLEAVEAFPPRYNIAPTQPILAVIEGDTPIPGSNRPSRRPLLLRWGLLPGWVKDPADFPLLINARAETAAEKASFRAAMRHRRMLIPASGFYEWHRPPKESGRASQAYWIAPRRGGVIGFAGLMETWSSADGSEIDTGAVLTTGANGAIRPIHDRMPVVITPENFARWLDCKHQEPREVADLLAPVPEDFFTVTPVSNLVNKVANSGPSLQEPVPIDADAPPDGRAMPETDGKAAGPQGRIKAKNEAATEAGHRAPPDQLSLF